MTVTVIGALLSPPMPTAPAPKTSTRPLGGEASRLAKIIWMVLLPPAPVILVRIGAVLLPPIATEPVPLALTPSRAPATGVVDDGTLDTSVLISPTLSGAVALLD